MHREIKVVVFCKIINIVGLRNFDLIQIEIILFLLFIYYQLFILRIVYKIIIFLK